jgi:pyrimidine deaminase RibD-like protein
MQKDRLLRYLDMAYGVARGAEGKISWNYAMGCVIASGKKILSTGHNEPINAKVERLNLEYGSAFQKQFFSTHAEIQAVLSAKTPVRGAWAFVNGYTVRSQRRINNTKPCRNCMQILRQVGIEAVAFYAKDEIVVQYIQNLDPIV